MLKKITLPLIDLFILKDSGDCIFSNILDTVHHLRKWVPGPFTCGKVAEVWC